MKQADILALMQIATQLIVALGKIKDQVTPDDPAVWKETVANFNAAAAAFKAK